MTKFMDSVYKYSVWIVIGVSLLIYFAYKVMRFDGSLQSTFTDWQSYVNILFVVWVNVNMVSAAYDSGTNNGVASEEFDYADKLNNKIIKSVNNEMKDFRDYVKKLNQHELLTIQEDYLFKVGDKVVEELTDNERKEFDKLKPIRHNIYGFNLPLYYEVTKDGEVNYKASTAQNEGKRQAQFKKIFTGILFGAMTVNMVFSADNIGDAFTSLMIISGGLIITFIMNYVKRVHKFRVSIPKKVILKNTLYNSYIGYKNGTHVLKEVKNEKDVNYSNDVDNKLSNDEL